MRTDADIAQLERILDFTERGCARTEPFGGERHRYTLDHLLDRLREEAGIRSRRRGIPRCDGIRGRGRVGVDECERLSRARCARRRLVLAESGWTRLTGSGNPNDLRATRRTDMSIDDAMVNDILAWTVAAFDTTHVFGGADSAETLADIAARMRLQDGIEASEDELREALALAVAGESSWTHPSGSHELHTVNDGWRWNVRTVTREWPEAAPETEAAS